MAVLIVAIVALALDVLTYVPIFGWFGIVGFVLAIAAWVMGRKIYRTNPEDKRAKAAMILGIIGTFAGLAGILIAFVLGGLIIGGFTAFQSF